MDTKHPLGTFSIPNVAKTGIRTWQWLIVPPCARESGHCRAVENMMMLVLVPRFESQVSHLENNVRGEIYL